MLSAPRTHRLLVLALLALAAVGLAFGQETDAERDVRDFARAPVATELVLGPHDVIEISVFELPELSLERRLTPDGTITLPLLGEVRLGGLSAQQAEEKLADLLKQKDLVINPQVSVFIKDFVSRRVIVQGAVADPGAYEMLGDRTLLDMIGEAGGLTDRAGDRIRVHRPFAGGEEQTIDVEADRLFYDGDPAQNILLQPGDIVMVPFERNVTIYVNGAVRQPGAKEFSADEIITVLQAVTAAGGVTDRANESRIRVIRRFEDGTRQIFDVNLKRVRRGKDQDRVLEPNDIVDVPESFF